jgi:hypothetical protein
VKLGSFIQGRVSAYRDTPDLVALVALPAALAGPAAAFCGFYAAKADSKLFNKSSKVVLSREGESTTITMASDYVGEPKEFAVVIPVPTFIERNQIGVVETMTINHLDAFTAPRLLRPLQVRYETAKFMLPLRLGTVNANGPQDLIVYALARSGRVETANYSTVKLPSDVDVPLFVKQDFGAFYKAMFDRVAERHSMSAVVVEYAGNIGLTGKCDPCVADAMTNKELVELGARWIGREDSAPNAPRQGANTYATRIHLRYDATSFPEDLVLMETIRGSQ